MEGRDKRMELIKETDNSTHLSENVVRALARAGLNGNSDKFPEIHASALHGALQRYTELPGEFIQTFAGLNELYDTLARSFVRKDDRIVIAAPTNDHFRSYAESRGGRIIFNYAESPFSPDPDGLIEKSTGNRAVIYLANPNYPTGTVYSNEELKMLLEKAPKALVIIDESFYEYYGCTAMPFVRKYSNLVIIRTFSEGFGLAGYPCAYLISSPPNIEILKSHGGQKPSDTALIAAAAALADLPNLQKEIDETHENLIYLSIRLRQFGISCRITPANVILLQVADSSKTASSLRAFGVFAEDVGFAPQLENYIALTINNSSTAHKVLEGFENMPPEYLPS